MKSLQESLFDVDLAKKNISALDVITNYIKNFISGDTSANKWIKCIDDICRGIGWAGTRGHLLKNQVEKIEQDEFYVATTHNSLMLIGHELDGESTKSSVPPIICFYYAPMIGNIYIDEYKTKGVHYKNIIDTYKFNYYKLDRSSIKSFIDNVYKKVEHVF